MMRTKVAMMAAVGALALAGTTTHASAQTRAAYDRMDALSRSVFWAREQENDPTDPVAGVKLAQALRDAPDAEPKAFFDGTLDYARKHQEVIERFGRFPHRNAVLGRQTTAEEQAFLDEGGFAG